MSLRRMRQLVDRAVAAGEEAAAAVRAHDSGELDRDSVVSLARVFVEAVQALAALLEHCRPEDLATTAPHVRKPILAGMATLETQRAIVQPWLEADARNPLTQIVPGLN